MKLNCCYINGLSFCEVPTLSSLVQIATKKNLMILPCNAKIILQYHLQNTTLFENAILYPQDKAALLYLKKQGFANSMVVDTYELWMQIVQTYNDSASFYFIGDNTTVLQSLHTILKRKHPCIDLNYFTVGNQLSNNFQSISNQLRLYKPDFVFIASSKKYSKLIDFYLPQMHTKYKTVYVTVDDSFEKFLNEYHNKQEKVYKNSRKKKLPTYQKTTNLKHLRNTIGNYFFKVWRKIHLLRFKLLLRLKII